MVKMDTFDDKTDIIGMIRISRRLYTCSTMLYIQVFIV